MTTSDSRTRWPRTQTARATRRPRLTTAIVFGCALFVASVQVGGAIETKTFHSPQVAGQRLDWCLQWGSQCGTPAADEFCRQQGFDGASGFEQAAKVGATRVLGTGQTCAPSCDGFAYIECATAGGEPPGAEQHAGQAHPAATAGKRFESPTIGTVAVDWCLNWGADCGHPAADRYCQDRGFTAASEFAIAEDVGPTFVQGGGQRCDDPGCDGFSYIDCDVAGSGAVEAPPLEPERVMAQRGADRIAVAVSGTTLEVWDGLARVDKVRLYAKQVMIDEKRQNLLWWFRWSTKAAGTASAMLQVIRTVEPPPIGPPETWLEPGGLSSQLVVAEGVPAPGAAREFTVDIKGWVHPPPHLVAHPPIVAGSSAALQGPGGNAHVVAQPVIPPAAQRTRSVPSSTQPGKHRFFVRIVPLDTQGQPSGPPSRAVEMTVGEVESTTESFKFTAAGFGFPDLAFAAASPGQPDTWEYWCHVVATGPLNQGNIVKGQTFDSCSSGGGGGFDLGNLTGALGSTLGVGFGFLHDTWEAGKEAVVSVAASVLGETLGCPGWCRGALEVGLTVAMTSVGLPPSVPNFDAIMALGKDYLVSQIAAELGKASPVPLGEELAKEAARAAFDEFIQQAKSSAGVGGGANLVQNPKYVYRPLIFMLRATGNTSPISSHVTARIRQVGGDHFQIVDVEVPPLHMNETMMIPVAMVPKVPPRMWLALYPPHPEISSKCGPMGMTLDEAKKRDDCKRSILEHRTTALELSKVALDAWRAKYSTGQVVFRLDLHRGTQEWAMGQTSCATPLGSCSLPKL